MFLVGLPPTCRRGRDIQLKAHLQEVEGVVLTVQLLEAASVSQ